MRTLLLPALLICSVAAAQEHPLPVPTRERPYDVAPRFPGGSEAMLRYFADSCRYPVEAWEKRKEGVVLATIGVDRRGRVDSVRIVNGVPAAPGLAREAERLLKTMPRWEPATKDGRRVPAEYHLSVPFDRKRCRAPDARP